MAVAFDAKATSVIDDANANTSPINNANLTVGGTATIVIGVFCSSGNAVAPTSLSVPTAMTWDQGGTNQAMTQIGHATSSDNISNIYVYAVVSPTTGNKTCRVTFTPGVLGSAASITNDLDVFSFTGSDTSSVANAVPSANVINDVSTTSNSDYPSPSAFSVTTANGDMACAGMNCGTATFATMSIGTQINVENANNNNYNSARNPAVGASTSIQFAGGSGTIKCCGVAFRISQPSAGDVLAAMPQLRIM